MFIGREFEMEKLNRLYGEKGFQMPVIYGRRRVGKTRLISEFCAGKQTVFYAAIEQNDTEALRMFSDEVLRCLPGKQSSFISSFDSWDSAFRYVADCAREERIVLVIDEFPYIASANPSLPSILQKAIDHYFSGTQLFLILCGSSMSFMEHQVLDYKSPLYGRRTAQFKIQPLDCFDSMKFFPGWKGHEQLYGYGITGGIPQYVLAAGRHGSFRQAVEEEFLAGTGVLFEEPANLMKQEMREPAVYNSILRAIAGGASRQAEISTKVGMPSKSVANYLKALIDLEILRKDYPFGDNNSRKVVYRVKDQLFRFWYRFIPGAMSLIGMGMPDEAFEKMIAPHFSDYFGPVFEDICRQYLVRLNRQKKLRTVYREFARWWGSDPETRQQEEIDIVGSDTEWALFGECKWKGEKTGLREMEKLQKRSMLLLRDKKREYCLFSRAGFTEGLRKEAERTGNTMLVDLEELLAEK